MASDLRAYISQFLISFSRVFLPHFGHTDCRSFKSQSFVALMLRFPQVSTPHRHTRKHLVSPSLSIAFSLSHYSSAPHSIQFGESPRDLLEHQAAPDIQPIPLSFGPSISVQKLFVFRYYISTVTGWSGTTIRPI